MTPIPENDFPIGKLGRCLILYPLLDGKTGNSDNDLRFALLSFPAFRI